MNRRVPCHKTEWQRRKWQTSVGISRHPAEFARNLDANESALKGHAGAVPIDVGSPGSKSLFGAYLCGFRALEIDFGGQFGGFREDGHAIRQNLREAAHDGKRGPLR